MVLEYDFDIVANEQMEGDPNSTHSNAPNGTAVRAQFRHVETADALRAASPKIRRIFQDAGFDLEATDSDLTHGYYAPRDAADREQVLQALFANIRELGIQGEFCGEFDFHRFIEEIRTAKPRAETQRHVPEWTPKPRQQMPTKPKRRTLPGRIGFALLLAVILVAVLRYLAETGSAP